jgi:hypothetical protein
MPAPQTPETCAAPPPRVLARRPIPPDVSAEMNRDRDADGSPLDQLFGEGDPEEENRARSPFGEDATAGGPAGRLHSALVRIRRLRTQVGSDGLSPAATRSLLDEIVKALEALEQMGDRP